MQMFMSILQCIYLLDLCFFKKTLSFLGAQPAQVEDISPKEGSSASLKEDLSLS